MARSIIYLNFNGNCAEAMKFYQEILGGELELNPVGASPMAEHMPDTDPDYILHSMLISGGITLMASDMVHGQKAQNCNGYNICLDCNSEAELNSVFDRLAADGEIFERPSVAPWGGVFAMLTDRFGKNWMFNYTLE